MGMDIQKILADLREQRDQVDAVIGALKPIYWQQQTHRRGRPPKWMTGNRITASKHGTNGLVRRRLPLALSKKAARHSTFAAASGELGE